MIIFEILWAVFILGLPVTAMSWYLVNRLYKSGKLSKSDDFQSVKSSVANLKKNSAEESSGFNFAEQRWMKFGGGFYGVTALTTWILIELGEVLSFVGSFPGIDELFKDGIGAYLVDLMLNQFQNFISSLIWFAYWAEGDRNLLVWLIVPYLAYLTGLFAAGKSMDELKQVWDELLSKNKTGHND